ncbi:MAG: hypothetical protein JOZ32_22045 [Bryobacterales bacterium]|nr:hypothetical protein [Bryobacterales bacterium]
MKFALVSALFFASIGSSFGQTPDSNQPGTKGSSIADQSAQARASEARGVAAEWDASKMIDALGAQAQHLKPIMDQVQPAAWQSKGASATYVAQWNSAQAQLKYLISSTEAFSRQPERLPLGLDTYFRMQAVEAVLGSLIEGVRKYQNPALASLMQAVIAENSGNRDRLGQYLEDLSTQKEEEFQVADHEAQRCRAAMLQQPAPKTKKVARP